MTVQVNPYELLTGANTAIGVTLGDEPTGVAMDFGTMQGLVRGHTQNFIGDLNGLLTYSSPSIKMVTNGFGNLESGTTLRCDHDPATLDASATALNSLGVGNGALIQKTLVTTGAVTYAAGQDVRLTDAADISRWMLGKVASWTPGTSTLVVNVRASSGYFAASSWKVIVARGLLLEAQRTNLVSQSQNFQSGYSSSGCDLTPAYAEAPDGTMTATRLRPLSAVDPGGAGYTARLFRNLGTTALSEAILVSVYVKPIQPISRYPIVPPDGAAVQDRDLLLSLSADPSSGSAIFNMRTMVLHSNTSTASLGAGVIPVGRGWYRLWFAYRGIVADTSSNHFIALQNRTGQNNFDPYPSGDEEVYLWGFQVESAEMFAGGPSSYIPTAGSQVTRAGDLVSLSSNLFPSVAAGMTMFADFTPNFVDLNSANEYQVLQVSASATNYARMWLDTRNARTGSPNAYIRNSSQINYEAGSVATVSGVRQKWSLSYDATLSRFYVNGAKLPATDQAVPTVLPSHGALSISAQSASINGRFHTVRLVPRLKSDAELLQEAA